MKLIFSFVGFLALVSLGWAEKVVLDNFDGTANERVNWTVAPEKADHDGDGDMEGKVTASGFKAIMKYQIPRAGAAAWLESGPVLSGTLAADRAENQVKFLSVLAVVQTDASDQTVYDPLKGLAYNPLNQGDGTFSFPLKGAVTKKGTPLADLVAAFEGGQGTFLTIVIIQQSPKGETTKLVYDDLVLTTPDAKGEADSTYR